MKIAFVQRTVMRTFGSTRRIVELSNALNMMGHQVYVYSKGGGQPGWIQLNVKVQPWGALRNDGPFDLVLFNNSSSEEYNLVRYARAEVRAFYILGWGETRLDEIEREIMCPRPGPAIQVIRSVFDDPQFLILACSTWIGDHLRDRYRGDTETLLGGINRAHFQPYDKPHDRLLRIYLSGDPRKRKGTDTTNMAIREMQAGGRHRAVMKTYWAKGMSQPEMGRWYSEATIFADAQHWAGWNNPVLEAMACKTPVVCTDIGGVRDFAIDGKTALLVPAKEVKAMAHRLGELADSETLRAQLAQRAYDHVQQFTWDRTAARLVKLVRERM